MFPFQTSNTQKKVFTKLLRGEGGPQYNLDDLISKELIKAMANYENTEQENAKKENESSHSLQSQMNSTLAAGTQP